MLDKNRTKNSILIRRIEILIILFMIALTLAFIWGNSMKSMSASSLESDKVFDGVYDSIIRPPVESVLGTPPIDVGVIRKLAHVLEFFLLGAEFSYLVFLTRRYSITKIPALLLIGLSMGGIDEIIQIFFKRGSQVIDVLIDFSGFFTATVLFMLAYYTFRRVISYRSFIR